MNITIQVLLPHHWPDVARIYTEGIHTGNATFEKACPEWEAWNADHRPDCRFVAINDGTVTGWAALANVSGRCVYSGVCEVSIYVDPAFQGHGIGQQLMQRLIDESEQANIWTLQAGIFPENISSIRLHEKNGFRLLGVHHKLGQMYGRWRDVALFERRSPNI